jgi:hypothetical protein
MPFISSECARSLLPLHPFNDVSEMLDIASPDLTRHERLAIYLHYLVARGIVQEVLDYLEGFDTAERRELVNATLYQTYFGNALHTCAYWNPTYDGLVIYRHLIEAGAVPVRDYYDNYPWEVDGTVYVCPVRGKNVSDGDERHPDEFTQYHADIRRLFHTDFEPMPLPPAILDPEGDDVAHLD